MGSCQMLSFFTIEVVQILGTDKSPLWGADKPFLAVVKIRRLANWVVRHDIKDKIFGAVVDKLMGFVQKPGEAGEC